MIKYYGCLNSETLTEGKNDGEVYKLGKTIIIKEHKTGDTGVRLKIKKIRDKA